MEREAQVAIGRKIAALIKKEVGEGFTDKYQGSTKGKVAIMVIIGSNVSFISKVKSYLWNHCHISPEKIKGHGSGLETTIKIHLSEFKSETLAKIEEEYIRVFPECKSKIVPIVAKPTTAADEAIEVQRKAMSSATRLRISISTFLINVFEFENSYVEIKEDIKNLFSYCKEKNDSLQLILCKNEQVAVRIEQALQWLIGNPMFVIRTGKEIMVNFSEMPPLEKRSGINFCFPPNKNATTNEVIARLHRVNYVSTPKMVSKTDNYDFFTVQYFQKKTVPKVLDIINNMGWNAWPANNGDLIICTHPEDQNEKEKRQASSQQVVEVSSVVEEKTVIPASEQVIEEEVHADKYLALPGFATKQPETIGDVFSTVQSKDEAFIELNILYHNFRLFSKLSPETKEEIKNTLKQVFMEEYTEEYVQTLLHFLK